MNSIKVSIIMPVFNAQDHLKESLDSALGQTLESIEVIAVNDGSTDNSWDILQEYAAKYDKLKIRSIEASGGPGKPRNVAIEQAEGEYLFFLDADDRIVSDAMECAAKVADRTGSDVVLLKMEAFGSVHETGSRAGFRIPRSAFQQEWRRADFFECNAYHTLNPCKLFRRQLIEKSRIRFGEGYKKGEDMVFTQKAYFEAKHVSVLSDKPYYWVLNKESKESHSYNYAMPTEDEITRILRPVALVDSYLKPQLKKDILLARFLIREDGLLEGFRQNFLNLDKSEQLTQLGRVQKMSHLFSDRLRHSSARYRKLLDEIFTGSVEDVTREIHNRTDVSI